jgi:beta-lactamase superfamily II metal-dependent hydrolase
MATAYVDEDLVTVTLAGDRKMVVAWGDPIEVTGYDGSRTQVKVPDRGSTALAGTVKGKLRTTAAPPLKLAMVDVQQGDALVLETPGGQVMLIDGGDNVLFARYLAGRFRGTSAAAPRSVAAILVTHGDADHFEGLNLIRESETDTRPGKAIFVQPERVIHNGLVKGPSSLGPKEIFGRTRKIGGDTYVLDLEDDLRQVAAARKNKYFKRWSDTLTAWGQRAPIDVYRTAFGDPSAFDFLAPEGIAVEVMGPITVDVQDGGQVRPALPLLHEPPKGVAAAGTTGTSFSDAHTINGHSVVFRMTYGNVRLFFGGDLNAEAMALLRSKVPSGGLEAEIVKVPHHGSADFDPMALRALAPVVWLISSGDESTRKEYIHPRADLMGALGRASRVERPLVFCTELAAFFAARGTVQPEGNAEKFFGFERTVFGIIHVRTDGQRVLVFSHSAKETMKEAYRFRVDAAHSVSFEDLDLR